MNNMMLLAVSGIRITAVVGQAEFTTPGTFQWTCPAGVYSVSAVGIGASSMGGAGGGLGWKKNIPVTPGTIYTIQVGSPTANSGASFFISESTVCGRRGVFAGGTYFGDGGGNGGDSGSLKSNNGSGYGNGGGGAGGYTGKGGDGGASSPAPQVSGTTQDGAPGVAGAGGGGGGGGGGYTDIPQPQAGGRWAGGGGGGTGIYGQGANGARGLGGNNTGSGTNGKLGSGGSAGTNGTNGINLAPTNRAGGNGGLYGGAPGQGGALVYYDGSADDSPPGSARGGAVRLIWGTGRAYPSTRTANE